MDHKTFCQIDTILTSAGVHLYNAHQDIRVNDENGAFQLLGVVAEELMNAAKLIHGSDPILDMVRGKPLGLAIRALPVSDEVKGALLAAASMPRPVSSHDEKMTRAGCQGRY